MVLALQAHFIEPGGLCSGRTYGQLIKSPADLQPEDTQDIQEEEFPSVGEDEA